MARTRNSASTHRSWPRRPARRRRFTLLKPVTAGQPVRWTDVAVDETSYAVKLRREMEKLFAPKIETELVH